MIVSRRQFGAAAIGGFLAPLLPSAARAATSQPYAAAIEAIRAYGVRHLVEYGLPGMTVGLTAPGGFSTVLNFGVSDREKHYGIGPDTMFEIGSITKVMTAVVIHQLVAEGRFQLGDRISTLLPAVAIPRETAITVQHLLDHVSGLASDPPLDAKGGLWTGFEPGTHWSYSNTGYEILGLLAEKYSGQPFARLLETRIFEPAGMIRSRGAILDADRLRYAQGYEAADRTVPFAIGAALATAPWVDASSAAFCVGSTAADMVRFITALGSVAAGRGGLGLSAAAGSVFAARAVDGDGAGMTYGNGLMHVGYAGRSYLHHTGGMVSFSSSFHLDVASGAGAFACTNLSAFAEFRPRLLTLFAAEALAAASAGRPVPPAPSLTTPFGSADRFTGRYSSPTGSFDVRAGAPLTIVANGKSAALQPWGGNLFRTTHPDFRSFSLLFEGRGSDIAGASWGPTSFVRDGQTQTSPPSDPRLASLAGRYVNDSPWWGSLRVVERGGQLWFGTEVPIVPLNEDLWRVGSQSWSPERAAFTDMKSGRPQTLIYSGVPFSRRDG